MDALAELRTLVGRYGTAKGFTPEALPTVRFTASTTLCEPVCSVEGPAFAMLLQGGKRTMVGEKSYNYAAGEFLVISLELPITAQVTKASRAEPFLSLGMLLRPAEIASLLLEGEDGTAAAAPASGVGLSQSTPELVDAVLRMVRLVERPGDVRVLRPMIEREILWRLLHGPQAALVRQIGLADSRLSQVSRAVGWIRRNFNKALRVEELAALAGMSASSFHRNFRAVTAMSPLQYQKVIRLQEARARLMSDAGDIAAVGFAVGYESPSQFSREYRRQFGETPGRDAARLVELAGLE